MYCISKKHDLKGSIKIPGSKSHVIRGILLASIAEGETCLIDPPHSKDALSATTAAKAFGAEIREDENKWYIKGTNNKPNCPDDVINTGNSGTTTTIVIGMGALTDGYTVITGDYQIRRRPQLSMVEALNEIGIDAHITRPDCKAPPVIVKGPLEGGVAHLSGFSSVFISSLLLIAPLSKKGIEIFVDKPLETPYIKMTMDWIEKFGAKIKLATPDFKHFIVEGNQKYKACEAMIPADWSSVAFPLVASIVTKSDVEICGVDFNDSQGDKAVVDHMIALGADIVKDQENHKIIVHGGKKLKSGLEINLNDIPDSLPAMSVAACFAEGDTKFTGLAHVRVKETDRVAVMEKELKKLGADIETGPDYMIVHGGKPLHGATVESYDDHRVAMAMLVAGLFADGETRVNDAQCAAVSFPHFFELMNGIGTGFETKE